MEPTSTELRRRFRDLHGTGTFVMPNPFDVGSALLLQNVGFPALATTSAGFAATLGRMDQHVSRDELVAHVRSLTASISVPLNIDAERCYSDALAGIAETIDLLAEAGAAGISIEDYDPTAGAVESIDVAAARVDAAATACRRHGIVLTARAENYLYDRRDPDDTIARLRSFREAGADAVYAPGMHQPDEIRQLVASIDAPLNVLMIPGAPEVSTLRELGVRRVSTGGSLTWVAYGGLVAAATELADHGTSSYLSRAVPGSARAKAFTA